MLQACPVAGAMEVQANLIVAGTSQARLIEAHVQRVTAQALIVRAHINNDRQHPGRVEASSSDVQIELADGDAQAIHAQIS